MESLAKEEGLEELLWEEPIKDMITRGFLEKEAKEARSARMAFPRIPQLLYPSTWSGGEGQHYNIRQVPHDVITNENTGLSFDFHIAIHFDQPRTPIIYDQIKNMVLMRLKVKDSALREDLIEPLNIVCLSIKQGGRKGVWAGIIKLHLLKPEIDAIALLKGLRPFILILDESPMIGKVCKSFHNISTNSNLSVKIKSDSLKGLLAPSVFKEVLWRSFKRGHMLEITGVQKGKEESFAFLVTTTPTQAKKIEEFQVTLGSEIVETKRATRGEKMTEETKAKKDALSLTLSHLSILMKVEETKQAIEKVMGITNVVSIWFHKEDGTRHNGSANVQCSNPIVYRHFVRKTLQIGGFFVNFAPHRRSLEGVEVWNLRAQSK